MKNAFDMEHYFCTITDFFNLLILNWTTYVASILFYVWFYLLLEKLCFKRTITISTLPSAFFFALFALLYDTYIRQ